ncbi:MAG: hypothetical protein J7L38_07945 [Thermoproteales archaeon]|nr:hypothetical protein [Thermoproteales archaeon]
MGKKPIYLDINSVYAEKEGVYVRDFRKEGIDVFDEAIGIATLILRDYRRGWTYDHDGNIIEMTETLAKRRLNYIKPLSIKHGATATAQEKIESMVEYALQRFKLKKEWKDNAKKAIVGWRKIAKKVKPIFKGSSKKVKTIKPKKPEGHVKKRRRKTRKKEKGFLDWLFG